MALKVLHIIAGLGDGGAEGVLTGLCLNSRDVTHVVVSLTDEGKYGSILRENGIPVHSLDMSRGLSSVVRFFQLVRLIRSERPDLVQTWMYHADLLGGLAAKLAGVRRIFWGIRQSTLEWGKAKRLTIIIARLCAGLSYLVPETIICCAEKAREVHASLGYCAGKLIVIPNGYNLSRFSPNEDAGDRVREQFGVNRHEVLLGMVGRYHPQKNHANLLEALGLLHKSGYSFRCMLVGTGITNDNDSLVADIARWGLTESILLAGPRHDIPEVMNALDLHVLSSSIEGFPNVVAESMSCGTPCVSTDAGDAAAIIADTGMVCPPEDPQSLAEGIQALLDERTGSPDHWADRKQRCRERIVNLYSLERTVGRYEAAWQLTG